MVVEFGMNTNKSTGPVSKIAIVQQMITKDTKFTAVFNS